MAPLAPGELWHERALELLGDALAGARRHGFLYPSGLLWGYPGLLCAAVDVLDGRAGLPLLS